jgi:fatty acid-binding protein DegV
MVDYLEEEKSHVKEVTVIHADNLKEATSWQTELEKQFKDISVSITELSPVPGTHTGRGPVGLAWLGE